MKSFIQFTIAMFLVFNLSANNNAIRIKITGNGYSDETVVRLHANATVYFDGNYDAWKLISSNPNVPSIYTQISPTQKLSINALPEFNKDTAISIFTNIPVSGNYAITISEVFPLDSSYKISLTDNSTGIHYFFKSDTTFSVQLQAMQAQASFTFNISKAAQITVLDEDCFGNNNGSVQLTKNGNTNWQIKLYNAQNTLIQSIQSASFTKLIDSLLAGNYYLEILSKGIVEEVNFSVQPGVLVVVNYSLSSDTVYLSEGANMQFSNNSVNALNYLWDFGDGVTSTLTNPSHNYSSVGNYEVSLKGFNGGCYAEMKDTITVELNKTIITSITNADYTSMDLLHFGNNTFEIKSNTNKEKLLFVTDMNGKCVLQNNFTDVSFKFDLGLFQSGVYVVSAVCENEKITEKIVIF